MQDKGRAGPDVAGPGGTNLDRQGVRQTCRPMSRNHAQPMTAKGNLQRAVVAAAIIEVKTQGYHSLKDLYRWFDMDNAVLDRPRTEAVDVLAFTHSDGAVLMPGDAPVGFGSLIERHNTDGTRGFTKQHRGDTAGPVVEYANPVSARQTLAWPATDQGSIEFAGQRADLRGIQHGGKQKRSPLCKNTGIEAQGLSLA